MNSKGTSIICILVLMSLFILLRDVTRKAQAHNMSINQAYEDLRLLIAEIDADVNQAKEGDEAAGLRVRNKMQDIKQAAQRVRLATLNSSEPLSDRQRFSAD